MSHLAMQSIEAVITKDRPYRRCIPIDGVVVKSVISRVLNSLISPVDAILPFDFGTKPKERQTN